MPMFHLLKIRTSIGIFKNEKCKVTFGLEYICGFCWSFVVLVGLYKVPRVMKMFVTRNLIFFSGLCYIL